MVPSPALHLQVLGCGPTDYVNQVQGLQAAKRDSAKVHKSLMDELAQLHGCELARQSKAQGTVIGCSLLCTCASTCLAV